METYDNIRKLVECELEKIGKMNELNNNAMENVYKLVDILKDLDEIEDHKDMMDEGYSQRMIPNYNYGNSYNRSMRSYNNGNYNRSYARGNSRNSLRDHLEQALNEAQTERERESILRMMDEM
jgi:hypothetical protein